MLAYRPASALSSWQKRVNTSISVVKLLLQGKGEERRREGRKEGKKIKGEVNLVVFLLRRVNHQERQEALADSRKLAAAAEEQKQAHREAQVRREGGEV